MYDRELARELVAQILTALGRIARRAAPIATPGDFLADDDGIDRLDAIAMMLIAVGERCKNRDKITGGALLARYPGVDRTGVKGMRDVLSHHYFDLDPELVHAVCRKEIPPLRRTFEAMRADLDS